MVDLDKIGLGDVVTVRGHVVSLDPNTDRLGGAGVALKEQWFPPECIITHTPRPRPRELKVGDPVKRPNDNGTYELAAIRETTAFLWLADFKFSCLANITDLRHADDSE